MRPALKAGLLPVWRDRETVQIGVDPRRAVALTGMARAAPVLGLLDGSRERDQVIAAALAQGVPASVTDQILTLLAAAGALDDFPIAAMSALPGDRRERMGAELAAAALARGHSDAGAAALARRDAAHVQIYGPGRIAAGIADILETSGLRRVSVCDQIRAAVPRPRRPAVPGRPAPVRADRPAAADARRPGAGRPPVGRLEVSDRHGGATPAPAADLAILFGYPDPELARRLMRAGIPHLAVTAEEAIGVVGPLVRPGRTACLRCVDLTRAALDPAWPLILAQLVRRAARPAACDAPLAAAVAAQASAQVLGFIDRAAPGPAENGTLELVLPGWQWRRRTWPRHPACTCHRPGRSSQSAR
jgi:bacteriocin biosynthesis cyclodehydratase domain-containing protein